MFASAKRFRSCNNPTQVMSTAARAVGTFFAKKGADYQQEARKTAAVFDLSEASSSATKRLPLAKIVFWLEVRFLAKILAFGIFDI